MIDLHAHILPGIDDGPGDLEASVAMARAMVEVGIDIVTTSSHIYPALGWNNNPEILSAQVEILRHRLDIENIPLQLVPSAEHFYDAELEPRIASGQAQSINNLRYLLVEFSTSVLPPNLPEVLFRMRRLGVEPLVAHVERYPSLAGRIDRVQTLVEQGYSLQVDAGAITGDFGREQKQLAWRLLDAGLIHVVASDAHRAKDVLDFIPKAQRLLRKRLGEAQLEQLWTRNPRRIVAGKSLDGPE